MLLATNRHVAVFDISRGACQASCPREPRSSSKPSSAAARGRRKSKPFPPTIIAADHYATISARTWRFSWCKGVKSPPTPLSVFAKSDTTEGMAYTAAGFPLGGMLGKVNENKGNPSVTITGGGIAALRERRSAGSSTCSRLTAHSSRATAAGPIVEEKTGKFIGVAVAKVGSVDTIGFVVPADEVAPDAGGSDRRSRPDAQNAGTRQCQPRDQGPDRRSQGSRPERHGSCRPGLRGHDQPQRRRHLAAVAQYKGVELQRDPKVAMASGTGPGSP